MYGCCSNPGHGYHYGPVYPSGNTYPVMIQCPYCMNQLEINVNLNYNMGMGHYHQSFGYGEEPGSNISPIEYGFDNIYPAADNAYSNVEPSYQDNMMPHYNNFGYIYPEENTLSPWDNNRMYAPNENPLPIPKPYNN